MERPGTLPPASEAAPTPVRAAVVVPADRDDDQVGPAREGGKEVGQAGKEGRNEIRHGSLRQLWGKSVKDGLRQELPVGRGVPRIEPCGPEKAQGIVVPVRQSVLRVTIGGRYQGWPMQEAHDRAGRAGAALGRAGLHLVGLLDL